MLLAVATASFLVFFALAVIAATQRYLPIDYAVRALVGGLPRTIDAPMELIGHVGKGSGLIPLILLASGALALSKSRRWWALIVPLLIVGASLLWAVVRWIVHRPRPDLESGSFPSGHVLVLVVFFGVVTYLVPTSTARWRWIAGVLFALTIALVAFNRLYFDRHWLSDIVAGFTSGLSYLLVVLAAVSWRGRRRSRASVPLRALALGTALLIAGPTSAGAQAELQAWLDPTLGKQIPRTEYGLTYYPAERVEAQRTDLRLMEHGFSLSVPVFQDSLNEWALSARVKLLDLDTRAILPEIGERLPGELWDVRVGAGYRHKFENNWIGGASLTVSSPSDEPFASEDELILRAIGMLRVPHGDRNAWLFSLIYASDQELLGGLPVPGIAYLYAPSDRFRTVIGVPFTSIEVRPLDALTLEAQYFPLRRVRARATYQLFRPLRLFTGFDWDNDGYFRADRQDKEDQLFYYEKRLTAGVRFDLRHVGFRLSGGYAFDRFYFEGDEYSDRRHNRIDVDAGPFVAAQLSVRF